MLDYAPPPVSLGMGGAIGVFQTVGVLIMCFYTGSCKVRAKLSGVCVLLVGVHVSLAGLCKVPTKLLGVWMVPMGGPTLQRFVKTKLLLLVVVVVVVLLLLILLPLPLPLPLPLVGITFIITTIGIIY